MVFVRERDQGVSHVFQRFQNQAHILEVEVLKCAVRVLVELFIERAYFDKLVHVHPGFVEGKAPLYPDENLLNNRVDGVDSLYEIVYSAIAFNHGLVFDLFFAVGLEQHPERLQAVAKKPARV